MVGVGKALAATETYDINFSSCPVFTVNVASAVTNNGSTQLFTAELVGAATAFSSVQEDRDVLFVQNLSTFAAVLCEVGLSSTTASADDLALTQPVGLTTTNGRVLPFRTSGVDNLIRLPILPRNRSNRVLVPFCVNNGATSTAPVLVMQCKR